MRARCVVRDGQLVWVGASLRPFDHARGELIREFDMTRLVVLGLV